MSYAKPISMLTAGALLMTGQLTLAMSLNTGPFVLTTSPESVNILLPEQVKSIIKQHKKTFDRLNYHICATASSGSKKLEKKRLKSLTKALTAEGVEKKDIVVGDQCLDRPSDAAVLFIQPIFDDQKGSGKQP